MIPVLIKGLALGLFQVLGVVFPRVKGQPLVLRDTWLNLANGVFLYVFRLTLVAWMISKAQIGLFDVSWLGPAWVQFLFALVVLDFARYWVHYADHRVRWLWTFHRVHHCSETLDASSGLRMHVVDFFQLSCIPLILFSVLFNGSQFEPWVIPAALAVGDIFDPFQHANIAWNPEKPVQKVWGLLLNNPLFHSWHHTRDGVLCDGNYGNTLVIWDKLFGTEVTRPTPLALFGIEEKVALENSLLGFQFLKRRAVPAEG